MRSTHSVLTFVLSLATLAAACAQTPAHHPYTVHDWVAARSAAAVAVSPDGSTILYRVGFGADSGPGGHEFWFIHPDGTGAAKLDLPENFSPNGFMPSGGALYGSWSVNGQPQFAVFPMNANKAAAAPTTVVALARGEEGILPSPDGTKFALLADPRPPDPLSATRTVIEPAQTSLYIVHADGTGGTWACPALHDLAGGPGSAGLPIAWSPDGTQLAVLSSSPKIGNHDMHSYLDLCPVTGEPRHLATIDNSVSSLVFSSSSEIAFLSTTAPTQTPDHLYTVATSGGAVTDRTPQLPTTTSAMTADAHGNVFVDIAHGVREEVDTWHDGRLTLAYAWPEGCVGLPVFSPYTAATTQTAFNVVDPTHTGNVAVASGSDLHRITHEGTRSLPVSTSDRCASCIGPAKKVLRSKALRPSPQAMWRARSTPSWCCRMAVPRPMMRWRWIPLRARLPASATW